MSEQQRGLPSTVPRTTLLAGVVAMLGVSGAIAVAGGDEASVTTLIAVVAANLPGMIAAAYSERASRDIRNGTLVEKSRQGATKAIEETGVVTREGPAVTAEVAALLELVGHGRQHSAQLGHILDVLERQGRSAPPDPEG